MAKGMRKETKKGWSEETLMCVMGKEIGVWGTGSIYLKDGRNETLRMNEKRYG